MLKSNRTSSPDTANRWRAVCPTFVFHRPKSPAYTPVNTSRTNLASVATARSMLAVASQRTFTPKGTSIASLISPMMRAMVTAVMGSVLVR
jgi:hypothetical protein